MAVFEILEDHSAMTISVGEKVFSRPCLAHRRELDFFIKAQIIEPPMTEKVEVIHKFYAEQLGPKFNRRFQAANYYMWIGNKLDRTTANMLRLGGFRGWRFYSPELVYRANQALPYVKEAEADKLHHLIPAIVVFGASPSAIRREIGKGAWKRIANNSRTRNKLLMQATERVSEQDWKATFVRLMEFPSGILPGFHLINNDWIAAARITPRKTPQSLIQTLHYVRDARRMLGDINPAWGFERLRREHDAAVEEGHKRRYSDKPFCAAWSFELDGLVATLLNSPMQIVKEGATQHHCVGSYADMAQRGNYSVLRVEGKERATIGLLHSPAGWQVDQVYGACNAQVSEACKLFSGVVAHRLNNAERMAA